MSSCLLDTKLTLLQVKFVFEELIKGRAEGEMIHWSLNAHIHSHDATIHSDSLVLSGCRPSGGS